jgi:hypothetical protein
VWRRDRRRTSTRRPARLDPLSEICRRRRRRKWRGRGTSERRPAQVRARLRPRLRWGSRVRCWSGGRAAVIPRRRPRRWLVGGPLAGARPLAGLGSRRVRRRGVARLIGPVRRFPAAESRRWLDAVADSDSLVGGSAPSGHSLRAEVCVVAVAGSRISGPAPARCLGDDLLPDAGNAERGVEEGGKTVLVVQQRRRADVGMQLRRVPIAVGREPPVAALGVVVQRNTPHPSPEMSWMSVASRCPSVRPGWQA